MSISMFNWSSIIIQLCQRLWASVDETCIEAQNIEYSWAIPVCFATLYRLLQPCVCQNQITVDVVSHPGSCCKFISSSLLLAACRLGGQCRGCISVVPLPRTLAYWNIHSVWCRSTPWTVGQSGKWAFERNQPTVVDADWNGLVFTWIDNKLQKEENNSFLECMRRQICIIIIW